MATLNGTTFGDTILFNTASAGVTGGPGSTTGSDFIGGLEGNDTIDGYRGADVIVGGIGDDSLVGGGDGDTLDGNDTIFGGEGNDIIRGGYGSDYLDGGTGDDNLFGGVGNDTYVVDSTGDIVTEAVSAGTDTVNSSITYTLGSSVENLTLMDDGGYIDGTGNTLNNVITGNSYDNILDGGIGNDTLIGGEGNDTYIVNAAGDVVTEDFDSGWDTVVSSVTYTLGDNVEDLTLTGISAINGTGNDLNNFITGNDGNNVLDGGDGTDTLIGGTGNDTFIVNDTQDYILEDFDSSINGVDTIISSASYDLNNTTFVENLILSGTSAIKGTGDSFNNTITGNTANNILDGGAGDDTLLGGTGNDTYIVDSTGDIVTEAASAGTDTVNSSTTYTLGANVEKLTLLDDGGYIDGTGNSLNNTIKGNYFDNLLDGGAGIDTLIGGQGNDTYIITAGDIVKEGFFGGYDEVQSGSTYALTANVENLTLTGSSAINGTGNGLDNIILGNTAANSLDGKTGFDSLDGGGGNDTLTGANATSFGVGEVDWLTGGLGSDTFVLATAANGSFYNDFNTAGGIGDYAIINDFNAAEDKIQLKSGVSYVLGAVPGAVGLSGTGIFIDNDGTSGLTANDELVGIIGNVTYPSGSVITPATLGFTFV